LTTPSKPAAVGAAPVTTNAADATSAAIHHPAIKINFRFTRQPYEARLGMPRTETRGTRHGVSDKKLGGTFRETFKTAVFTGAAAGKIDAWTSRRLMSVQPGVERQLTFVSEGHFTLINANFTNNELYYCNFKKNYYY
jgi:hypothetical protein